MKKRWAGNNRLFFMLTILLIAGCGLKANPVSTVRQAETPIKLTATVVDDAIVLFWAASEASFRRARIERSVLGTSGNICKDCPRNYQPIAELTVAGESRYADNDVEKGKSYDYRVSLCDADGHCHGTQTIRIDMK